MNWEEPLTTDRYVGVDCLSYRQRSYYWCIASGRVIICIFLVISYFVQEEQRQ